MPSPFNIGIRNKADGFKYQVPVDLVLYVYVIENYIYIYTSDGKEHEKKCSMEKFISCLPSYLRLTFIRFGKKHCLNRCLVAGYKSDEVKLNAEHVRKLHHNAQLRIKDITPTQDSIDGLEACLII
jgi:hypothetical protein